MHPLSKRIAFLVSAFCLILGLFLLGSNLLLIPQKGREVAVALWPVLLVLAGILLVTDSYRKRRFTRSTLSQSRSFPLNVPGEAGALLCRLGFSYGTVSVGAAANAPALVVKQFGSSGDPSIQRETRGATAVFSLDMAKPLFPTSFQLLNSWELSLPRDLPLSLELNLHEADLLLDLRALNVESMDIRADSREQKILIGALQRKLVGQIFSSATSLSLTLPSGIYIRVMLLNPFCRIDYPQGDFEKREDGSFESLASLERQRSVEITIDGPIKNLVLDVEESEAPYALPREMV
jgi:hypothetical protein